MDDLTRRSVLGGIVAALAAPSPGLARAAKHRTTAAELPAPSCAPAAVPAGAPGQALPFVIRQKGEYLAHEAGNPGQQYQRFVARNEGTGDPAKHGWIMTGQDESNVRLSVDDGATWGIPPAEGLFCACMSGGWLNTDDGWLGSHDGLAIAVGNDGVDAKAVPGVYFSTDLLQTFHRYEMVRASGPGPFVSGSRGPRRAFSSVMNGASCRFNQNCVTRRPQTPAGQPRLSDAERPIWLVENCIKPDDTVSNIFIWRNSGGGAPGDWEVVTELDAATYASGKNGLLYILCARNGDVMVLGKQGAWVTQDGFATLDGIYSGEVRAGAFVGGDAETVSGAVLATQDGAVGVARTPNVRTTAPARASVAKPHRLPPNYKVWNLGVSPVNDQRIAVCGGAGKDPFLSTDGGAHWSKIVSVPTRGDGGTRYDITHQHSGFYFSFHDELECVAMTQQTATRSRDGGANFDGNLMAHFDGAHTKGAGFDPADWRRAGWMQGDYGARVGLDGANWVQNANIVKTTGFNSGTGRAAAGADTTVGEAMQARSAGNSRNYTSGSGIVMCPNGRIIVFLNRNVAGQTNLPFILDDPGSDGKYSGPGSTIYTPSVGTSRCSVQVRSPKDPDVVFIGKWVISNLGAPNPGDVSWDSRPREILDAHLEGGTLVSLWGDYGPGAHETDRTGSRLYRSESDAGVVPDAPWYALPVVSAKQARYLPGSVAADPHKPERVLYSRSGDQGEIREIRRVSGRLAESTLVNLRTMKGGIADYLDARLGAKTYEMPATQVVQAWFDANLEGVIYAIVQGHGIPVLWMSLDDGASWFNATGTLPRTYLTGESHPHTGNPIFYSSFGSWCLPVPDGYPKLPNANAFYEQLVSFYDSPAIPRPPQFSVACAQSELPPGK